MTRREESPWRRCGRPKAMVGTSLRLFELFRRPSRHAAHISLPIAPGFCSFRALHGVAWPPLRDNPTRAVHNATKLRPRSSESLQKCRKFVDAFRDAAVQMFLRAVAAIDVPRTSNRPTREGEDSTKPP